MKLKQEYPQGYILYKILKILKEKDMGKHKRELRKLKFWLNVYLFDRAPINNKLKHYALNGDDPENFFEEVILCG